MQKVINSVANIEAAVFSDAWNYESITDSLKQDYNGLIIIDENSNTFIGKDIKCEGEIAGYILYSLIMGEAELLRIAVSEENRKNGFASILMDTFFGKLREEKAEKLFLEVRADNVPAINLYKKCNFKEIAVRKNYYRNPASDAVIMEFDF